MGFSVSVQSAVIEVNDKSVDLTSTCITCLHFLDVFEMFYQDSSAKILLEMYASIPFVCGLKSLRKLPRMVLEKQTSTEYFIQNILIYFIKNNMALKFIVVLCVSLGKVQFLPWPDDLTLIEYHTADI